MALSDLPKIIVPLVYRTWLYTLTLITDNNHSQSVAMAPNYALRCHQLTLDLVNVNFDSF